MRFHNVLISRNSVFIQFKLAFTDLMESIDSWKENKYGLNEWIHAHFFLNISINTFRTHTISNSIWIHVVDAWIFYLHKHNLKMGNLMLSEINGWQCNNGQCSRLIDLCFLFVWIFLVRWNSRNGSQPLLCDAAKRRFGWTPTKSTRLPTQTRVSIVGCY